MERHLVVLDKVMDLIDFVEDNDIDPALGILLETLSKLSAVLDLREPQMEEGNVVEFVAFPKGSTRRLSAKPRRSHVIRSVPDLPTR